MSEVSNKGNENPLAESSLQEMDPFNLIEQAEVREPFGVVAWSAHGFELGSQLLGSDSDQILSGWDSCLANDDHSNLEHGPNNLSVSGIHCSEHLADDGHPSGTEHGRINYESSQVVSSSTWPQDIRDTDGTLFTSGGNRERERLESDSGVPKVGMEFTSEEEVYDFINEYAKKTGFRVWRGNKQRSQSGDLNGTWFRCSKYKPKKQINKPTQDTIRACKAKIKCRREDGNWKISVADLKHNHGLKGCLTAAQDEAEDSPARRALSTSENVDGLTLNPNVGPRDVLQGTGNNHSMIQDLIDHFDDMQIKDLPFFCTSQEKEGQGMRNFFWRDGRSMLDYEHFGDVLVLDTRTTINHDMICAAFWGLNHHQQRIIFGCAFLVDGALDSFKWLLKKFLKAMNNRKPHTIITEISNQIAQALRMVWPGTSHCLSYWSLLNSCPINVGNDFSELIFHVRSKEQFDSKWNDLLMKYKLHEYDWAASLYEMREKWCYAFTKKVFSAGLLRIQNEEHACAVFENLSGEMTLSQIACQCGKVAEHMRSQESNEDRRCKKRKGADLISRSLKMEKQAQSFYTKPIFKMFQEELMNVLSLVIEETEGTAPLRKFKLTEETEKGSTNTDFVEFDTDKSKLVCSCGNFESIGFLCFHALKVLNFLKIFEIPSYHLSKRWMKSAKDNLPASSGHSFREEFMLKASRVAIASGTEKKQKIASTYIDLAIAEIAKASKTEELEGHSEGINDMCQD